MRIFFILIPFTLLLSVFADAQNLQLIAGLKKKLHTAQGETQADLLTDLAWEYRTAYPDSTILFATQAYKLSERLNYAKGISRPLNFIGVAKNYKGDKIGAFESYYEALKVADQHKDSVQQAYANNNIGRLLFEQGLLGRAYAYFIKALNIFEKVNDPTGLAYTYQSLANLYKSQKDYSKAERNYIKAYTIRLKIGSTRDVMSALEQIGAMYQESGQHEKALAYFNKADSAGNKINDAIGLAEIKTYAAESYLVQNKLAEAEKICQEGLNFIVALNNVRSMAHAYLTMGQIQFRKNDLAKAKHYFTLALEMAKQTKNLTSKMDAYYFLWKLSERENNSSEILKNQNLYLIIKDSIKDLDLTRQVERLQFEVDIQRKEHENELLKINDFKNSAVIKQQKIQNGGLIAILFFVSCIGVIQFIYSRRRRKSNETLALQNEEIEKQRIEIIQQNQILLKHNHALSDLNNEKNTLMSIVAHDLKSPLNRIKGVTNLMYMEGGLSENQKEYLKITKAATQAGLDLITDLLDVNMLEENIIPTYTRFDISLFLLEKIKDFTPAAEAKDIHLNITRVENDEVYLDADYMARIMDNLLTNAIKFSTQHSSIHIAAGRTENTVWISIKDEGPGFTDEDKKFVFQKFKKLSARPTAGETSNGLGLAIVKTLVDRLKGEIQLISEPEKGSEFILKFPVA